MNSQKREFPQDKLNEFLDAIDEAHTEQDPQVRKEMLDEIHGLYGDFLQKYERPTAPMQVEKPLIGALDYIPGAIRAIGGEAALAATGHGDMAKAKENIGNALIPFSGKMAPMSKDYLERAGVKWDTPISATDTGKALGFNPNGSKLDPRTWMAGLTGKGAAGTALDVLASPETFGTLKGMVYPKKPPASLGEAEMNHLQDVNKSGLRVAGESAGQMLTDPAGALGDLMARWRFRNANRATAAKGRRAYSDVWQEHGAPGAPTADGQARAAEQIIADEAAAKKDILAKAPANTPKTKLSNIVDPALNDPDFVQRAGAIGDTEAYDAAKSAVEGDIQHTLDKRATPAQTVPTQVVGNNGQPLTQVIPPQAPTRAQTPVTVQDLERLAKTAQDKASTARQYAKPGIGAVKNLTDLKMTPANGAYGELWADIGMNARDAQAKLLDQVEPGLGGQIFEANKDISSAATGAPFINRNFNYAGNASSRAKDWAGEMRPSGWWGIPLGVAKEGFDVGRTGAAQALLSPTTRKVLAPAARAKWSESFQARQKNNPWMELIDPESIKEKK